MLLINHFMCNFKKWPSEVKLKETSCFLWQMPYNMANILSFLIFCCYFSQRDACNENLKNICYCTRPRAKTIYINLLNWKYFGTSVSLDNVMYLENITVNFSFILDSCCEHLQYLPPANRLNLDSCCEHLQ